MHKRLFRSSLIVAIAAAAITAAGAMSFVPPAFAQTCAYNSTQGSCACPTSGAGATCFNGTLYRASGNDCGADGRPCASNQQFDCTTLTCTRNTVAFPCGGCTVTTSTIGASCASPPGGKYSDQCGNCACPSGTMLCSSSNSCVTNLTCPTGSTFDPCLNACTTPYVLVSPALQQNGYISVSSDIYTGNNFFIPSGKAIHVDAAGTTSLNIGNWGGGGTGVNVDVQGALGIGTAPGAGLKLDAGANGAIRGGTFTNGTSPASTVNLLIQPATGTSAIVLPTTNSAQAFEVQNAAGLPILDVDTVNQRIGIGTWTPGYPLEVAGTAKMTGFLLPTGAGAGKALVSDASGNGTWQTLSGITGAGTANYYAKFNAAGSVTNGVVYDDGTNVGIGNATPGAKLDVTGTARMTGLMLSTGAAAGRVLTSDASGNGTWQVSASAPVTSVSGSGAGVSVVPTTGAVVVSNTGVTSLGAGAGIGLSGATGGVTVSNNGVTSASAGSGIGLSGATGPVTFTNTGVTSLAAGAGISINQSTGGVTVTNTVGPYVNNDTLAIVTGRGASTATASTFSGGLSAGTNAVATGVTGTGSTYGLYGQGGSYGLFGQSGQYGVGGSATLAGVYGVGSTYGVYGGGGNYGVYGNGSTYGVYGSSTTYALYGQGGSYGAYVNGSSYGLYSSGGSNYFAGNVGLGTNGPDTRLVVLGSGSGAGRIGPSTCGGNYTSMNLNGQAFSGCSNYNLLSSPSDPTLYLNRPSGYSINFRENNVDQMVISPSSGDIALNGKHAFRTSDSWLRLNQDGAFTSGVHTPGLLAPGALNVGGANGWGNPGGGNEWVAGSSTVYGNMNVGGQLISNGWFGWHNVSASYGGDTGDVRVNWNNGSCINYTQYAMISINNDIRTYGGTNGGGYCHIWQNGGDGCWYKHAWANSNGWVNCEWYIMKFK